MNEFKTAVVCPVFNETQTWRSICKQLTDQFDLVVVVDDGSDIRVDGSGLERTVVIRNDINQGKGAALAVGFAYCLAQGADVIATIDSDGEHDPRCLENPGTLLGSNGMVALSREHIFDSYSWARRWRNILISKRLSRELGVSLFDTQSGLRIFSAPALRTALSAGIPPGYAVESLMLRSIVTAGFEVRETHITHHGTPRPEKRLYNPHALKSDLVLLALTIIGWNKATLKGKLKRLPARNKLTS